MDEKPNYNKAHKHAKEHSEYRLELRRGRTLAVKLCNKLIQEAIDGNSLSRQHLEALAEIMKDAREVLGGKANRKSAFGTGHRASRDEVEAAEKVLEE